MVTSSTAPLTREEVAQREIGQTDVSPRTARSLLIFFLVAIVAVPVYEIWGELARPVDAVGTWSHLARIPADAAARASAVQTFDGPVAWQKLIAANRAVLEGLHRFEEALEDDSRLAQRLRPPTQSIMSGWLGAGNERAYPGHHGWLFYRPDVEYVTGVGFLDPQHFERRIETADEWTTPPQPDPRKAIIAFKQQLDARGITLVVMPTPLKPEIHPEYLAARYAGAKTPLQNASYGAFIEDLTRAQVLVFDAPAAAAAAARASQTTQYLATDTHWRPEAMETIAEQLVAFVRQHVMLPEAGTGYRLEPREIQNLGDIALMLDLPATQTLYAKETTTIRRVVQADGSSWRPSREADVLVLGDSFSNIFSLATMGWGDSAGFVEHVSYQLDRPVDRIVQNDQGAFATRELLRRSGDARLQAKRVVIYQFAARELMFGDWKNWD